MVRFWCAGILTFVLASQPIWGQNCDLPRVAAEFSLLKNDICEGQIINIDNTTLENGHTNIRYIMDWGDGIRDTVMGKQKMTHQYNLSSFDPCGEDNVQMEMKLIAIPLDCPSKQHNVTKPVFVTFKPRPDFSSKIEICIASPAVTFTNQSCPSQGLNYRWNFGDPASASNASAEKNPTHTFSGTGDFTVTLVDSNVCGTDAKSKNIRVVGLPKADFSFIVDPATACLPNPIADFKNNSNQWSNTTWSITPNDTLKWRFTDTSMRFSSRDIRVRFIQAGQYTVRLTASNVCPQPNVQEEKIQIYAPPSISLQSPGAFCDSKTIRLADLGFKESGAITAYRWTFVNGTPSSAVGRDFPPVTFTQSGAIALLAESPCGNVADTVPILIASTMPVDISSNKTVYCQNEPPLTLSAIPTGGSWLINGRTNAAIDAQGVFQPGKLAPGKYALTYTAGTVQCPNEQDLDIEVKDSVSVALEAEPIACETLRYTPKVKYKGQISAYAWTFAGGQPSQSDAAQPGPVQFSGPGQYLVAVSVTGACGAGSDSIFLDVQQREPIQILYAPVLLCSGSSPDTLKAAPGGGTWSGKGIADARLGVFDPGSVVPGEYKVTYSRTQGACASSGEATIRVVESEQVRLLADTFCVNSPPRPLQADKPGGAFFGRGITDSLSGLFDPLAAGIGPHEARYRRIDANQCPVETTAAILVEDLPSLTLPDTLQLCLSAIDADLPRLTAFSSSPTGGKSVWSGPGIRDAQKGLFNSASLTEGAYTLRVRYDRHDCSVEDSLVILLAQSEKLTISTDTSICISEGFLQLRANLSGGRWSGAGVDSLSGRIDLVQAGGGDKVYTYVLQKGTTCEQQGSLSVRIIDLGSQLTAGPPSALCEGPATFQLPKGMPATGYFTGPGLLDAGQGIVDLRQLRMDTTYTYQYCLRSSAVAGCEACKPQTLRIHANPNARFSFIGTPCINQEFRMQNLSGGAASYSWDFGDGTVQEGAEPAHRYRQRGTYSLTLIATSSEGCRDTSRQTLYITTPPVAGFTLDRKEGCAPFTLALSNRSSGDSIRQYWIIGRDTLPGADPGSLVLDGVTRDSFFLITLAVENLCGEVRQQDSVLVHPYPMVDFGISQDEGCSPSTIAIANTSKGNPQIWRWDMGNGNVYDSVSPPPQIYRTGADFISEYVITATARNACGEDSLSKTVTVYPPNVRAFIEKDTFQGCPPMRYRPRSYSTPGASVSWKVVHESGKVEGSEKSAPEFILKDPGRYTVVLYASNCGTDTDTAYVDVLPAPAADFSHRPYICQGQPIVFQNASQGIHGSRWSFGDGSASSDEHSPTHVFDSAGVYQVRLTVFSELNNCPAEDSSQVLVVGNPAAAFSAGVRSGCYPLEVRFENFSAGSEPLTYAWNFGDGSSFSTDAHPVHVFERPGNFPVTLTVYDRDSCFADTSVLHVLVYERPKADFYSAKEPICLGHDSLHLINRSTGAVQWEWTYGEEVSSQQQPVFWPRSAGTTNVRLIARNPYGCADTLIQPMRVLESPQAQIGAAPFAGCAPLALTFSNSSRLAGSYLWEFDGNSSTLLQPQYTFRNPGTYQVRLTAISSNGCPADQDSAVVEVYPRPQAAFAFDKPEACGTPAEVVFTNQSRGAQGYYWDYGDGGQSTRLEDVHEYAGPGTYTAQLIAENTFGCRDTMQQPIDIFGQPVADFEVLTPEDCAPMEVQLLNRSEAALSYRWTVAGIGEFSEENPVLRIENPGTYDIVLTALYNDRCQDSLRIPAAVRAYQSPTAGFAYQANIDPNLLGDVQFYNTSRQANRYRWQFGDGSESQEVSPFHEYSLNRELLVTLTAYQDNQGAFLCTDSITQEIAPEWLARFYAPNAMTPGYGDEAIQRFKPTGVGIQEYEIRVFSPQGQIVWQAREENQPTPTAWWDGTFGGAIVPQGAYAWIANVTFQNGNKRVYKGTVTVLR